jgi:hypothetical protein
VPKPAFLGAALFAALVFAPAALGGLERITSREAATALKAALERGSLAAVATLGRTDGFFANPQVKIPLPHSMQRAEKLMRRMGMARYADELIVALNRAAEAAVPHGKAVFIASVRSMSVQDAKAVLQGNDAAATAYFRASTEAELRKRFRPIVQRATEKVHLAQQYKRYAEQAAVLGLLGKDEANLDDYVTEKALDGLFFMLAEEERKIRKDPLGAGSAIIRKVFGAVH